MLLVIVSWDSEKPGQSLELQKIITHPGLTPKSVVHTGNGLFFSQNMMYSHNISVYNRQFERIKVISDAIDLSQFGHVNYKGKFNGAPVECAFSHNGLYAWVSNYRMYGNGFHNAASDNCRVSNTYDKSFIYKINTKTFAIEQVVQVGCVPKFVATTPDSRYVLASNWCSGDVSIIDCNTGQTIKNVYLGIYPRGIAVDSRSEKAYVAVMGSSNIGVIDLNNFSVKWLKSVGTAPRHLCISPDNTYLYVSLNHEGKVAKVDLTTGKVVSKVVTGSAPRSMAMLGNGAYLYVCNYSSNTLSKIRTEDMKVLESVATKHHPIGVTTDAVAQTIWVACYSGSLMVFNDTSLKSNINTPTLASAQTNKATPDGFKNLDFSINNIINKNKISILSKFEPESPAAPKAQTTSNSSVDNSTKNTKNNSSTTPTKQLNDTAKKEKAVTIKGGYYIIIGSYKTETQAKQYIGELKSKGLANAQVLNTNTNQYRIAANYFKTRAEANQGLKSLVKMCKDAWVLEILD